MSLQEQYDDVDDDAMPTLASGVKLLIMAASLGLASTAGFYLHPHLPPLCTESVPQLWQAAQRWLTTPVLFLLLNVVVGTLYFRSTMLAGSSPNTAGGAARTAEPPLPAATAAAPDDRTLEKKPSTGFRARLERSNLTRLGRSKSEQIPPISAGKASDLAGASATGRLKKAGTFETSSRRARKPVVVVADPPEDAAPPAAAEGQEEVDEKAEAFISRFYQRVKLQRLDSLLRQQRQQQQAN